MTAPGIRSATVHPTVQHDTASPAAGALGPDGGEFMRWEKTLAYRVDRGRTRAGHFGRRTALALSAAALLGATAAGAADPVTISLELNKLESIDKGCRVYTVVDNTGTTAFSSLKLDLILFQSDGVIGRRLMLDLAPLKNAKKTVKMFDLDGTACDKIGSFLIHDVMECKSDAGPVDNCLDGISVKSLSNVQLLK